MYTAEENVFKGLVVWLIYRRAKRQLEPSTAGVAGQRLSLILFFKTGLLFFYWVIWHEPFFGNNLRLPHIYNNIGQHPNTQGWRRYRGRHREVMDYGRSRGPLTDVLVQWTFFSPTNQNERAVPDISSYSLDNSMAAVRRL